MDGISKKAPLGGPSLPGFLLQVIAAFFDGQRGDEIQLEPVFTLTFPLKLHDLRLPLWRDVERFVDPIDHLKAKAVPLPPVDDGDHPQDGQYPAKEHHAVSRIA